MSEINAELLPERLEYVPEGNFIYAHFKDGMSCRIADIRGWGHLTGHGHARRLDHETAIKTQEAWGQIIVDAYNTRASAPRTGEERKFALGDRVSKIKGSSWNGKVVGFYSTELTPVGYAIESEREPGSVQIYPEAALIAQKGGGDA